MEAKALQDIAEGVKEGKVHSIVVPTTSGYHQCGK